MENTAERDLIWVLTPFERPDARAVVAAVKAGAVGVLDLGTDRDRAASALDAVAAKSPAPFAVRVPGARCALGPEDLPTQVSTVVVGGGADPAPWRGDGRRVIAEAVSLDEARAALAAGVDGLIAKGAESGGRIGSTGAFVLLQQIVTLAAEHSARTASGAKRRKKIPPVPVWVQGGIGRHTAAAAIVGGAAGVVVDVQAALLRESAVPPPIRSVVAAMDGSETRVLGGHRLYTRPDLWVAKADPLMPAGDVVARLGGDDLTTQAVPVGQDGAFAEGFRTRYGTIGHMVAGLRRSILDHATGARDTEPLAPGGALAADLGTQYPVVQGPMTRVSDQPAFAEAVASGGGLPFLALALLTGPQVRTLLEEARDLLGDRPWGVGILGFVPKDLREEQLAVIREIAPPMALIAGGRPSQAVPLEEVGTRTFLHVPSAGLLARFLKDGARRFVFEGSECGGHVGPRTSFALWESQVETLLAHGKLADVSVLFAGGVHDERSAAMVAALAAPLAAAGARVGVLMGTAYLFTGEAVDRGAITAEFQAQALACERTSLLESGPGHVTRCAETPFVDTFNETRERLISEGADHGVVWAELEGLNLGRLRVASKGLKREGDDIVEVDVDEQRRDGMYMIGEVATMHRELTTIAQLHESVTAGATRAGVEAASTIENAFEAWQDAAEAKPVDIAIIGMSAIMPGAADVEEFWHNIVNGLNSITEVPPERFDTNLYYDPGYDHANAALKGMSHSASKWGGFVPDVEFDALSYGIPPNSLASIEPVQLLALKAASDALSDAGYVDREFDRDAVSVIFGAEGGTDMSMWSSLRAILPSFLMGDVPQAMVDFLPSTTEDTFPGLLTNVIAGRIANRLDLGGKNYTVDAACASSLAALDAACMELASGSSDMVLCGGSDTHNGVHDFLLFTSVHALSTRGQCRTFDSTADGIVLAEGAACVVLKRLADAERDGDRVYAVIKGVSGSSDGRSLGLTAPRQEGQERAVRRTYARSGMSPADVELVEAHGTGTVVGDRTELATLTRSFTEAGAGHGSVALGSVKSNVGHSKCTAGLASLVKTAKAVYHGVLPPTLHIDKPNREWDADKSPFVFLDEARPWLSSRRVAALSAFGFGGTNFHVVMESHEDEPAPEHGVQHWPAELFLFRGRSDADVDAAVLQVLSRLDEGSSPDRWRLRDAAAAISSGRGPVRLAVVAESVDDLRAKLQAAQQRTDAPGIYRTPADVLEEGAGAPAVAFLFPGQGSQRPGMGADLFTAFTETRDVLCAGTAFASTMLPPATFSAEDRDEQRRALTDTRAAQPALGLVDLAVARVLRRAGVSPTMLGGHSYGELVALCEAGAFDADTLLALSVARADAILEAAGDDPGAMVAVAAERAAVEAAVEGLDVVVANDNHPKQLVLAGPTAAIDEAVTKLKAAGMTAKRLPVACAFHSPVVAGAAEILAERLADAGVDAPSLPVWSNLTAGPYPDDTASVRELLAGQVANGVRFTEQIRSMYEAGARVFVEVGPGRVLTSLVDSILGDEPHTAVACDRPGGHGVTALLHALGRLAAAGVPVDHRALIEGRDVDPSRWTDTPRVAGWTVNGHLVRTRDGKVMPGGLRPANEAPRMTLLEGDHAAAAQALGAYAPAAAPAGNGALAPAALSSDQLLASYFHTANQLITSGRDIVLQYLGMAPANGNGNGAAPPAPMAYAPTPGAYAPAGYSPQPLVPMPAAFAPPGPAPAGYAPSPGGPGTPPPVQPLQPAAAPAPPAAPAEAAPARQLPSMEEMLAELIEIVSARTGYPPDMLDPDLDVEADLSIDSIKRLEILGELSDKLGFGTDAADVDVDPDSPEAAAGLQALESLVEELAARKTLRGIVEYLHSKAELLGAGSAPAAGAVAPAPAAAPAPGRRMPSSEEMLAELIEIVSARTGYPPDMLDPDLDVEADLSIDSIKRLEILGELSDKLGFGADSADLDIDPDSPEAAAGLQALESLVEELAQRKTLRGIVEYLQSKADELGASAGSEPAGGAGVAARAAAPTERRSLPSREELLSQLVEIVSARTGYPPDMLDPDLDVEADLSIDSIKRLEILGELADQIGLSPDPDAEVPDDPTGAGLEALEHMVEELAQRKTLRGIVEFLHEQAEQLGRAAESAPAEPAAAEAAAAPVAVDASPNGHGASAPEAVVPERDDIPARAQRYTVELVELPAPTASPIHGTVAVCGTGQVAHALCDLLAARGVDARSCLGDRLPDGTALVVMTQLLDDDPPTIPELYEPMREHLIAGSERSGGDGATGNGTAFDVVVVSGLGGGLGIDPPAPLDSGDPVPPGAGVRGLIKTAGIEFTDRAIRLVDVDRAESLDRIVAQIADELGVPGAPVEVGWRDGVRRTAVLRWSGEPAAVESREPALGLTDQSVILALGGARGITAGAAIAMARQSSCRVELAGRSPLPEGPEDPDIAAAADRQALRSALIARGMRKPREIEQECDRLLAAREVRATLDALAAAGSEVRYHQVDVREADALAAIVRDVYERHGRIDGVIHGAGMLDDHFITEKTPEAFARVFSTKVDAARTLLQVLREDPLPRFIVFFGSIAGAVGNRGQADYAAANDALDLTAIAHADRAARVVSIDWGPWEPSIGMVSEELARVFLETGVGMIEQGDGTRRLLAEIAEEGAHHVVVARCKPEMLGASESQGAHESGSGGAAGAEPAVREDAG